MLVGGGSAGLGKRLAPFPARKRRANDLFLMRRVVPLGYFHGDKGCRAAEGRERTPLK